MKINTRKRFKKGLYAEKLVKSMLHNKGYVVYHPFQEKGNSKWELFDMLAMKREINGSHNVLIADIKAKARMHYYNAVAIELRHYKKYCKISKEMNIPFKMFVVDEFMRKIYGFNITSNMLDVDKLKVDKKDGNTYPHVVEFQGKKKSNKMILFSLDSATVISSLSDKDTKNLRMLNDRPTYKHIDFDNSFTEEQQKLAN